MGRTNCILLAPHPTGSRVRSGTRCRVLYCHTAVEMLPLFAQGLNSRRSVAQSWLVEMYALTRRLFLHLIYVSLHQLPALTWIGINHKSSGVGVILIQKSSDCDVTGSSSCRCECALALGFVMSTFHSLIHSSHLRELAPLRQRQRAVAHLSPEKPTLSRSRACASCMTK